MILLLPGKFQPFVEQPIPCLLAGEMTPFLRIVDLSKNESCSRFTGAALNGSALLGRLLVSIVLLGYQFSVVIAVTKGGIG
jgi:hypothetical protein